MSATLTFPILEPVIIPTKGKNKIVQVWIWLTVRRKWRVVEDYFLFIHGIGKVKIPKDFIFDGASIARIFHIFLQPTGILFLPHFSMILALDITAGWIRTIR